MNSTTISHRLALLVSSPLPSSVVSRIQSSMNTTLTLPFTYTPSVPKWDEIPLHPRILSLLLLALPFTVLYFLSYLSDFFKSPSTRTTPLPGPPSPSLLFGSYQLLNSPHTDPGSTYESWSLQYGPAFLVPGGFGSSRVVICDARANAHFYARETVGYVQTRLSRVFIENLFGRGLLWAEGESHRRQRKALSPAFSNAAIRKLTPVFYDAAYKMKAIWDSTLDAAGPSGEALIDVQVWMNNISLDSVGIAGFGHDFHALSPPSPSSPPSPVSPSPTHSNPVVDVFTSFSSPSSPLSRLVFLLGPVFPALQNLPTEQNLIFKRLRGTMGGIADELLRRNRVGGEGREKGEDKSIIGLLIKAEMTNSSLGMSQEEILAQMNVLLLAGYETTSISLTWALIELSRKPDKQQKLREELAQFVGADPTFDQLNTGLPYLDAVVQEVLRLHPPVSETTRVAAEDDIIPFSTPFTTASGEQLTSLVIKKGTVVTSPIRYMNRAEVFWGADGKEFVPERWLAGSGRGEGGNVGGEANGNGKAGLSEKAKEIQGHKHILTFSDGPRTCLGRSFALAEFKAVLSVLIRNYTFELPDGPNTKIEKHPSILPRPKVAGEDGARVPLRVYQGQLIPTLKMSHFPPTTMVAWGSYSEIPRALILSSILAVFIVLITKRVFNSRDRDKGTKLPGPPSPSLLFGTLRVLANAPGGRGEIYEQWAKTYGPAYRVPGPLGSTRVVLCDPRAIAHFYAKDTWTYVQTKFTKVLMANIFGRGLMYAEGESHRRQRKALSPAFSNASIRKLTHVFYDAAYKVKANWDATLHAASGEAIIDVQVWMNRITLDSIGIAGLGHDFQALDGKSSSVFEVFESFGTSSNSAIGGIIFLLSPVFPWLLHMPTRQNRMLKRMRATMSQIADELLARNRSELDGKRVESEDKSIIGLLVKAEMSDTSVSMSREEVLSQNLFLIAGYETTAISLTWALIELSRHPEKQHRLRDELLQHAGYDPTFEQLSSGLPYLDAVVQEVLRLHPTVMSTTRVATEDDIIPFCHPVKMASGEETLSIVVKKGETLTAPISYVNGAEVFWGPESKKFVPERWLEPEGLANAKDIQGHRHILTFSDGPRICLGRQFALTEFKAVLSVLIRYYAFEFQDGPNTKIGSQGSFSRRPKIAEDKETGVYLRVRRME